MRDFCKPEFSRPYFFDRSDNMMDLHSSPEEKKANWTYTRVLAKTMLLKLLQMGLCKARLIRSKQGFENSGIGLFINFVASTEQSDFSQHNTISHQPGIVHFCDKAGELCGAWAVMYTGIRTAAWVIEAGLAKAGYYAISQRGVQYVFDNVMQVERPVAVTDEFASSTSTRQFMAEEVGSANAIAQNITKGARNRFVPDENAVGAHSVFRRDPITGRVTHYETYIPQTKPYDPKPWQSVLRYDGVGKAHLNKEINEWISAPHVHDPFYPGAVRYPKFDEIPN